MTHPRLGFLGTGWIGRNRLAAVLKDGQAEVCWVCDASPAMLVEARKLAPAARFTQRFEDLLEAELDGIVIATPSALHAAQSIQALEHGKAVFCQKPLGRNAKEVRGILSAARSADRLLAVDLSYRYTRGMQVVRELVQRGELGQIFAVELAFHNGYGPDKPWFYQPQLSGGGCVIDLGVHLVDLALWTLGFPKTARVTSQLFRHGRPLMSAGQEVEDYAVAHLALAPGISVQLGCSWNLHLGRDAAIGATFFGTNGGISFRNVQGSFYDFAVERFVGTKLETLISPPDDWGGRAIVAWAHALAAGTRYDPDAEPLAEVAAVLDAIYLQGN